MERSRQFLVVLCVLAVSACAPESGGARRWVELELAVGPDGARVIAVEPTASENAPADGPVLHWVLEDLDGRTVARGEAADTREVFHEDPLAPELSGGRVASTVGTVRVRAPRIDGTLVLRDASGAIVAELSTSATDRRVSSLALLSSGDVLAPATQIAGGAGEGVDLLFLPEGYTEAELGEFHETVAAVVESLSAQGDYALLWDHIRVWRQDVRSRTSGIGEDAVAHDTAFDVAYGISGLSRCAFFATSEGRAAAERLRREAGAEAVVILANGETYGGCAGRGLTVNVATSPTETAQVVAHEIGHALFGLADEYDDPHPAITCTDSVRQPNVTSSLTDLPWADLVTTTELPTPVSTARGVVGAFEGAGYCPTGRYRPTHDCLMRNVRARMCPVCLRHAARTVGVTLAEGAGMDAPVGGESSYSVPTVLVVNRTGAELWARCAGTESAVCTGWVQIAADRSVLVASFDRRLELDNQGRLPGVDIDGFTFTARADRVEIFPNAANPLEPAATTSEPGPDPGTDPDPGPDPGADPGTDPDPDPITATAPVIRDAAYDGTGVDVVWDRVAGATEYWVYALAMTDSTSYAGYSVVTVPDAAGAVTASTRLPTRDICDAAGPGTYGLVVQVMVAGDDAGAQSEWVLPVGAFTCE